VSVVRNLQSCTELMGLYTQVMWSVVSVAQKCCFADVVWDNAGALCGFFALNFSDQIISIIHYMSHSDDWARLLGVLTQISDIFVRFHFPGITLLVKVSATPIIHGNCSPCGLCHTYTNKSDFPSNASGHYYTVLSMLLSLSESRRSRVPSHIFPPCHCFGIQFLKPVILCQKLRFVCCSKELIVEIAQETNCRTPRTP